MKHLSTQQQIKPLLHLLLLVLTLTACGSDNDINGGTASATRNDNANTVYSDPAATRTEVPHLQGGNSAFIAYRTADKAFDKDGVNFSVEWDRDLKANRWTCYVMTKQNSKKNVSRWHADRGELQYPFDTQHLTMDDYQTKPDGTDCIYGSGFDHGHLCPSNDRLYSQEVNKQTFYLTNMQPQYKEFNGSSNAHKYKGQWINLENWIYNFVQSSRFDAADTLFICKGGTIDQESQILMRRNNIIVPKYFYAAIVWKRAHRNVYSGIAFWYEHTSVFHDDGPEAYAISIDELEKRLDNKIDFFCNLPDNIESTVEKTAATIDFGF